MVVGEDASGADDYTFVQLTGRAGLSDFAHCFFRETVFVKYSQAFVVLPGGFGTSDALTLSPPAI